MKVQIYSQWMEDVYIPVRVKQFTKAAKLAGKANFMQYYHQFVQDHTVSGEIVSLDAERQAVTSWVYARMHTDSAAQKKVA